MQNRSMKYCLVVFLFFSFLLIPVLQSGTHSLAWAGKAEIVDFTITRAKDYIYIDAKLKGPFTSGIKEAIASGIPTTFRYYVELYKPRQLWFDKKKASMLIQHSVTYDTLTKEYRVTLDDGISSQVRVTKDEREMRGWMASLVSVRFAQSWKVPPSGGKYRIRLKAEMKCIKMPFPLNYLLYYPVSFFDFDTPWATSSVPAAVSDKSAESARSAP